MLELRTRDVAVDGPHAPLLHPTTLRVVSGQRLLVAGEPGHGHTALALLLAGRLLPSAGRVTLDGQDDLATRQRAVALVDTPGVTEPDEVLPLGTVVGEGLAMAGRPARRASVHDFLRARGLDHLIGRRLETVPAVNRTRVLTDLAALRPDVGAVVLTAPDRHGAPPGTWWSLAADLAAQDLAVVVTCTHASVELLGAEHVLLGNATEDHE